MASTDFRTMDQDALRLEFIARLDEARGKALNAGQASAAITADTHLMRLLGVRDIAPTDRLPGTVGGRMLTFSSERYDLARRIAQLAFDGMAGLPIPECVADFIEQNGVCEMLRSNA